jgi:hypothetical protein
MSITIQWRARTGHGPWATWQEHEVTYMDPLAAVDHMASIEARPDARPIFWWSTVPAEWSAVELLRDHRPFEPQQQDGPRSARTVGWVVAGLQVLLIGFALYFVVTGR